MKIGTEEIALGVSGLSLLLSGLAIAWDRRTARKLEALQLEKAQRDEGERLRAEVWLEFESWEGRPETFIRPHTLWVLNNGPAVAEKVMVEPVQRIEGNPPIHHEDRLRLPIRLEPGQRYPLRIFTGVTWVRPGEVKVSWEDGTGPRSRTERIG